MYDILIVDDHALIVDGIIQILQKSICLGVVDTSNSGKRAVELIGEKEYDLYLLDVELPDISGVELVKIIREKNPDARIIINTMHEEIWIINQLVKLEVNAVILKTSASAHLTHAVNCVLQDIPYTCPRFEKVHEKLRNAHPKDMPTKREREILYAISEGLNTHQMAVKLGISDNTVETFRKRLIQKFNAKNSADLLMMAIKGGWIDLNERSSTS